MIASRALGSAIVMLALVWLPSNALGNAVHPHSWQPGSTMGPSQVSRETCDRAGESHTFFYVVPQTLEHTAQVDLVQRVKPCEQVSEPQVLSTAEAHFTGWSSDPLTPANDSDLSIIVAQYIPVALVSDPLRTIRFYARDWEWAGQFTQTLRHGQSPDFPLIFPPDGARQVGWRVHSEYPTIDATEYTGEIPQEFDIPLSREVILFIDDTSVDGFTNAPITGWLYRSQRVENTARQISQEPWSPLDQTSFRSTVHVSSTADLRFVPDNAKVELVAMPERPREVARSEFDIDPGAASVEIIQIPTRPAGLEEEGSAASNSPGAGEQNLGPLSRFQASASTLADIEAPKPAFSFGPATPTHESALNEMTGRNSVGDNRGVNPGDGSCIDADPNQEHQVEFIVEAPLSTSTPDLLTQTLRPCMIPREPQVMGDDNVVFDGWSLQLQPVTGSVTYQAHLREVSSEARHILYRGNAWAGRGQKSQILEYGVNPAPPGFLQGSNSRRVGWNVHSDFMIVDADEVTGKTAFEGTLPEGEIVYFVKTKSGTVSGEDVVGWAVRDESVEAVHSRFDRLRRQSTIETGRANKVGVSRNADLSYIPDGAVVTPVQEYNLVAF